MKDKGPRESIQKFGVLFLGPYLKEPMILGPKWGPLIFGDSQLRMRLHLVPSTVLRAEDLRTFEPWSKLIVYSLAALR